MIEYVFHFIVDIFYSVTLRVILCFRINLPINSRLTFVIFDQNELDYLVKWSGIKK